MAVTLGYENISKQKNLKNNCKPKTFRQIHSSKAKPTEYSIYFILFPTLFALSSFAFFDSIYSYFYSYSWSQLLPPVSTLILPQDTSFQEGYRIPVNCSSDYQPVYQGCTPEKCGRLVIDGVFLESDIDLLQTTASTLVSRYGGSSGGATILDLHSGALSLGDKFLNIYTLAEIEKKKNNNFVPVVTEATALAYSRVKTSIEEVVKREFLCSYIHLTKPTFFSKITNLKAKSVHDEYWHPHVDKLQYGTFTYTSLVYLNDYGIDFEGGRFIFDDDDEDFKARYNLTKTNNVYKKVIVEPRKGRLSIFTSGSENVHHIEKVSAGTRFALTVSFTCQEKHAIELPKVSES